LPNSGGFLECGGLPPSSPSGSLLRLEFRDSAEASFRTPKWEQAPVLQRTVARTPSNYSTNFRLRTLASLYTKRVMRCLIHYSAPNGKVYPFCTYNSGPCFREKIERQFSVPFDLKAAKAKPSNGNGLVSIS